MKKILSITLVLIIAFASYNVCTEGIVSITADISMPSYTESPHPSMLMAADAEPMIPPTPAPALHWKPVFETPSVFPKTYDISETDAERYQRIRQNAIKNIPIWITKLFPTLEEKAAQWNEIKETISDKYYGIMNGLPTDDVISEEWAVFLGYAALEERYGYDEDILCVYYPDMTYDVGMADKPAWKIRFVPYGLDRYGSYYIDIEAKTGVVLKFRAPEDPRG